MLAVYSQPPRPAGRGHRLQPSPVQLLAERHGFDGALPGAPARRRGSGGIRRIRRRGRGRRRLWADLAARDARRPPALAASTCMPRCCRAGAARRRSSARSLAGDAETGITIMQMEEGLDTGPILMQRVVPIGPTATAAGLTEALARLGGELIVKALDETARGRLDLPRPQPQEGVTYAPKILREEGRLDWRQSAEELERRVRALDPWPGALLRIPRRHIRVLAASGAARHRRRAAGNRARRPAVDRLRIGRAAAVEAAAAGARARSMPMHFCAAVRSRPEPCCRAPLQADDRI